jgi:beta-lactamase superfamily II metal-dependent hydrolase
VHALAAAEGVTPPKGDDGFAWTFPDYKRATPGDHKGFSSSDFDRLRSAIREEGVAAARFIDRAENNTSLSMIFEVAGKRLMLAGDAELESWAFMRKHCSDRLKPLDFLKVSHHGSHNGTPTDLLDTILPVRRAKHATVLVSTKRNVYGRQNPVPDQALMSDLKKRCKKLVTTDGAAGTCVTVTI